MKRARPKKSRDGVASLDDAIRVEHDHVAGLEPFLRRLDGAVGKPEQDPPPAVERLDHLAAAEQQRREMTGIHVAERAGQEVQLPHHTRGIRGDLVLEQRRVDPGRHRGQRLPTPSPVAICRQRQCSDDAGVQVVAGGVEHAHVRLAVLHRVVEHVARDPLGRLQQTGDHHVRTGHRERRQQRPDQFRGDAALTT